MLQIFLRVVSPLIGVILLPKVLGINAYSDFLLQYYLFLSVLGIAYAPMEQVLISSKKSNRYYEMVLIGCSLIFFITLFVYSIYVLLNHFHDLKWKIDSFQFFCLLAATFTYISSFSKLARVDFYYRYSDAISQISIIVFTIAFIDLIGEKKTIFPIIYFAIYLSYFFIFRLYYLIQKTKIKRNLHRNLFIYKYFYSINYLSTLVNSIIKRSDSIVLFYFFSNSNENVILYRFIRSIFSVGGIFSSLRSQDYWLGYSESWDLKRFNMFFEVFLVSFVILVTVIIYSLLTFSTYHLDFIELVIVVSCVFSIFYQFDNVRYFIDTYKRREYKIINIGAFLSIIFFVLILCLICVGFLDSPYYILVLIFLPQLLNAFVLKNFKRA